MIEKADEEWNELNEYSTNPPLPLVRLKVIFILNGMLNMQRLNSILRFGLVDRLKPAIKPIYSILVNLCIYIWIK